ncbi:MAG: hypothetical protein ACRESR_05095, partial [Gammaproteobacteria bacterium]
VVGEAAPRRRHVWATATLPLHFNSRIWRTLADCMPRNDGQEMLEQQPRLRGVGVAAGGDLTAPPYVRFSQRGRLPRDRRSNWILMAVVLAAHVLLVWIAYVVLRPSPYHQDERGVFQVTLIEPTSGLPAPPPLVAPPPLPGQAPTSAPARHLHYVPPAKGAMSATLEGVKGPPLDLYAPNGQIRLPPGSSQKPASAPAYSAPEIKGSQIYSGKSPVPYKPTPFNKDWAPVNESLGAKTVGRAFDKIVEKTTVQKSFRSQGGHGVHCVVSPLILMFGCGGVPPPPPQNDDDIRLSMPPPETLTGKKVPLPKSASSALKPASTASAPPAASSS